MTNTHLYMFELFSDRIFLRLKGQELGQKTRPRILGASVKMIQNNPLCLLEILATPAAQFSEKRNLNGLRKWSNELFFSTLLRPPCFYAVASFSGFITCTTAQTNTAAISLRSIFHAINKGY